MNANIHVSMGLVYNSVHSLLSSGGSKSACPSLGVLELLDLLKFGEGNPLDNELADPLSLLNLEVFISKVEEENLDLAPVVGIDHAGSNIDEFFDGKSASRG